MGKPVNNESYAFSFRLGPPHGREPGRRQFVLYGHAGAELCGGEAARKGAGDDGGGEGALEDKDGRGEGDRASEPTAGWSVGQTELSLFTLPPLILFDLTSIPAKEISRI